MRLGRRALLVGAGVGLAAGCGRDEAPPRGTVRHRYGSGKDQYGELSLPSSAATATAVLLHGGYWREGYGLDLMRPIARALVAAGWAVWNLEYSRVGDGGGWPRTFTDVAAGVDHVRDLRGATPARAVVLGHSAGGQLAAWAVSRTTKTPGGEPKVALKGAVSLAGVLELRDGAAAGLGGGAITDLLGGTPSQVPDRYDLADPVALLPAAVPVACLHGRQDDIVPLWQSRGYVAAARKAGGQVSLDLIDGDHFTLIDPKAGAWSTMRRRLDQLAGR